MSPCPGEAHAPGAGHIDSCAVCAPYGCWGEVPVIYVCECELEDGEGRALHEIVSHEGVRAIVRYCDGCSELAALDWNGETATSRKL